MAFWIGVACAEHVRAGALGGFAQLGHGRHAAVKVLRRGDWIAYYSPTSRLGGGEAVRAFTAIGEVTSENAYQAEQGPGFRPWRVDVAFEASARAAPIRPLLEAPDLTGGRGPRWGIVLRGGRVRASEADRRVIAEAMGAGRARPAGAHMLG